MFNTFLFESIFEFKKFKKLERAFSSSFDITLLSEDKKSNFVILIENSKKIEFLIVLFIVILRSLKFEISSGIIDNKSKVLE